MSAAPTAADLRERLGARGGNARCPAHEDEHASLSISEGDDGVALVKCHAGCSQEAVIEALRDRGLWPRRDGLTVAALAAAKRLPESLLRESGFSDDESGGRPVIRMEYRDAAANASCIRYRGALGANGADRRFWFRKGDRQQLYGLWRLRAEPVIVVEGETDALALWADGFNAIGVPGAEAWREQRFARALKQCSTIYVHLEPDAGGKKFRAAFEHSSLRERVRFFTVAPAAKDPCELRAREPERFRAAIEQLLAGAQPAVTCNATFKGADVHGIELSEDGIALAFAERYADRVRFCHTSGSWYLRTETHWRRDATLVAFSWARDLCRAENQLGLATLKKTSTAGAVERAARADQRLAATFELWDRDPMLLGTPGGVVDLSTGDVRPAKPEDYITKQTAVAPADSAEPELWLHFLEQATRGDFKLIRFLQQIAGYALTGDVREHALFFVHGDGGNGKGVFVRTVKAVLGDYAITAPMDVFTEARGERHPTELAMLCGARLVTAEETEQGRVWAQARIKALTGGDAVTARYMRQDFFTFEPTWKLLLVGNHQPILRNVDAATRRRFNVIPFTFKPEVPDMTLEARLQAEYPSILRWMIEGALDWQANGLVRPAVVETATRAYFEAQDRLTQWLDEACDADERHSETNKALFQSWSRFAEENGWSPGKSETLSDELIKKGFERIKDTHGIRGRGFRGIRVKPIPTEPHWADGR